MGSSPGRTPPQASGMEVDVTNGGHLGASVVNTVFVSFLHAMFEHLLSALSCPRHWDMAVRKTDKTPDSHGARTPAAELVTKLDK